VTLYTEILGQIGAEIPKELSTSRKYGGAVVGSGSGKIGIPLVAEGKVSVDAYASAERGAQQCTGRSLVSRGFHSFINI
jgi:hypothetical protein